MSTGFLYFFWVLQSSFIKVLFSLYQVKKNKFQKEKINKLNDLIENLNYMRLYLFRINKNNLERELNSNALNNIKDDVKSQLNWKAFIFLI